jgi:hypothetical protein
MIWKKGDLKMNNIEWENYVGAKIIRARKVTLMEYKKLKYGEQAKINNGDECILCYVVLCPAIGDDEQKQEDKAYIFMSPVEDFEKIYRKIDNSEIDLISDHESTCDHELK